MRILFKIMGAMEWTSAERAGVYEGSPADHRDGFIHLSAAHQARETAAKHFAGQDDLVLVAYPEHLLENLKWEPSRGGDLFPHVYGELPVAAVAWVKPLPLVDGMHRFPDEAGA